MKKYLIIIASILLVLALFGVRFNPYEIERNGISGTMKALRVFGVFHGPVKLYDYRGTLRYEANYKFGNQTGVTNEYDESGMLCSRSHYENNDLVDTVLYFYPSGQISEKVVPKDQNYTERFDTSGNVILRGVFTESGFSGFSFEYADLNVSNIIGFTDDNPQCIIRYSDSLQTYILVDQSFEIQFPIEWNVDVDLDTDQILEAQSDNSSVEIHLQHGFDTIQYNTVIQSEVAERIEIDSLNNLFKERNSLDDFASNNQIRSCLFINKQKDPQEIDIFILINNYLIQCDIRFPKMSQNAIFNIVESMRFVNVDFNPGKYEPRTLEL